MYESHYCKPETDTTLLINHVKVMKVTQLCPTLWDPMNYAVHSSWNSPGQNTGLGSISVLGALPPFPAKETLFTTRPSPDGLPSKKPSMVPWYESVFGSPLFMICNLCLIAGSALYWFAWKMCSSLPTLSPEWCVGEWTPDALHGGGASCMTGVLGLECALPCEVWHPELPSLIRLCFHRG